MSLLDQQQFKLTLLTPVHIGSGETLNREVDILEDRSRSGPTRTFVLDIGALLNRVTEAQADEITRRLASQQGNLLDYLLSLQNLRLEQVCLYPPLQRGFPARELRLHIRRGDGNPIIPGSSLKGALRTLILTGMTLDSSGTLNGIGNQSVAAARKEFKSKQEPDAKRAAQPLEDRVFRSPVGGANPKILEQANGDLLRCLHSRDVDFSPKDLDISFVKVQSPSREHAGNFKPFTLAVETLKIAVSRQTELTIDHQLLQGQWAEKLNFANRAFTWEDLSRWSHTNAQRFLEKEKKRAEQSELQGLPEELGNLQSRIQQAVGKKAIALRLGWGIGWEGTTGGVADIGYRKDLLGVFRKMGRDPNFYNEQMPFPKSRKLVELRGSNIAHERGRSSGFNTMAGRLQAAGARSVAAQARQSGGYGMLGWILLEPL